jgi:Carboxypeptidase regulatory-like domain
MIPDVVEQVVLVRGRILHQGTQQPIIGVVEIKPQSEAQQGWVTSKLFPDGTFVVSGRPEVLFPNLANRGYILNLIIQVKSPQFSQDKVDLPLSVPINPGFTFDNPIDANDGKSVDLPAEPVTIRGRVVKAKDPDIPIANATIEVISGTPPGTISTATDINGRYSLTEAKVLAPAEIRCSAAGFKPQQRILLLDFSKVINEESFRLTT